MTAIRRFRVPLIGLMVGILVLSACSRGGNSAQRADQNLAAQQLKTLQVNQPTPSFAYSQLRQNLIEIETAQANTTQTTSFFFNQGVADPVQTCPSIGFPIPATDEITNPDQVYDGSGSNGGGNAVIGQVDPTGVFAGTTTATYVICVNAAGKGYAFYWEGFVGSVSGAVAWDYTTHRMAAVDNPTAQFSTGKK